MEEGRVRICDIAEELGVSTATVSNVLHGKTKKISEATVARVQALLEEKQYIPSMAGILLAQNTSSIIGVVINNHAKYETHVLDDMFIASALNNLSNEIEQSGHFMMIKKTTQTEDIIRFASMWNMEGLVLIGFCEQDYCYLRSHMRIPFVVYDGYLDKAERICNLTIDNYNGGYQVGEYLRKGGHSKVLCISDNQICMDRERYEGLCAGLGGKAVDWMIVPMQQVERKKFYEEHWAEIISHTAVFAVSDYYAIDLMHLLLEHGVSVPEQISVVGFDDTPACGMVSPALTSVRQDVALRAKMAIGKLQELREGKEVENCITIPVTLIERGSSRALHSVGEK